MDVKWVVIGEIAATQGNKGEVRVFPHTDFPERFLQMKSVTVFASDGHAAGRDYAVESGRWHKKGVVLKLAGVDSIDAAAELKGHLIQVPPDELMPLPEGRHYIFQLVGLTVVTEAGQIIGTIEDVLKTGANDVYSVRPPRSEHRDNILIPVTEEVVKDISLERGMVTIEPLEGLLD